MQLLITKLIMKLQKKISFIATTTVLFFTIFFASAVVVQAEPLNTIELDPGGNFANNSQIGEYVVEEYDGPYGGPTGGPVLIAAQIINILLQLLGLVSLLLIFYGGFIWMMARGNDDEIKKAKDIIIGTTVGLLVILASYSFMRFVFEALLDATDTAQGIFG